MRNRAILRNALRKRNYELPSGSNHMQSSETLRNSLGLNYETVALRAELRRQETGRTLHPATFTQGRGCSRFAVRSEKDVADITLYN